jgi:DNA-directed RNA polymerase subunit RPC12/RpoP
MSYELISQEKRKARKEHNCLFCGRIIEKGEQYYRQAGKYYSDFCASNYCELCEKVIIPAYCDLTRESEWGENEGQRFIFWHGRIDCPNCGQDMEIINYDTKNDAIIFACRNEECSECGKKVTHKLSDIINEAVKKQKNKERKNTLGGRNESNFN